MTVFLLLLTLIAYNNQDGYVTILCAFHVILHNVFAVRQSLTPSALCSI